MTQLCLVPATPVRWHKRRALVPACIVVSILIAFAAPDDSLNQLKSGVADLEARHYPQAVARLKPLVAQLPKLADYAAWFLATAQFESADYAGATKTLAAVWTGQPPSPLAARAAILSARAYTKLDQPKLALETLRLHYEALAQPRGDLALADAFAAAGDAVNAVIYYQRVYYGYPLAAEASQAEAGAARLRSGLGESYPPAMPRQMLGRALKLLDAGQARRAKDEIEWLIPRLGGAERDLARVRAGAALYANRENEAAWRYLRSLEVTSPDADSERLSWLVQIARRLKNQDQVARLLDTLARLYPNSRWRLEALNNAGNHYLLANQMEAYEPLYRACYEAFPNHPQAAYCHWKVVWGHYLRRRAGSADLLRAHLRNYPASENAPAALYFLGRLAEYAGDRAAARAWYDEIVRAYPNYYYTILARERVPLLKSEPAPGIQEFLRGIAFPQRARVKDFEPNARAAERLERARSLASIGLEEWAEDELRFGAQNEDQPHVLAVELAAISSRRVGPDQAMRWIKRYASGYLFFPVDSAPQPFWKLAFPLPYRSDLDRFSRQNGLDPFLVAALIRQESEFNPKAVSRANARGLTQIVPPTGRELSRKLKIRPYSTASLFQPATNLQLGTYHLKTLIDILDGRIEAALASYNAGLSRAHAWLSWGEFREPAEFIETIPFTETRNYVQTVLRNADLYRRLYGGGAVAALVAEPAPAR